MRATTGWTAGRISTRNIRSIDRHPFESAPPPLETGLFVFIRRSGGNSFPKATDEKSDGSKIRRLLPCGERGIRTPGTVTRTPHFECGPIDHSGISPIIAALRYVKHRLGLQIYKFFCKKALSPKNCAAFFHFYPPDRRFTPPQTLVSPVRARAAPESGRHLSRFRASSGSESRPARRRRAASRRP